MSASHNGKHPKPTYPPPPLRGLAPVLDRNIEALRQRRLREESASSAQDRIADAITRFSGSMLFVYIHLAVFGFWIVPNLHWLPGVPACDESFVVLAKQLGVKTKVEGELKEVQEDVAPDAVLDQIENKMQ